MQRFLRFGLRYGALGILIGLFYANTVVSDLSTASVYEELSNTPSARVGIVLGTSPRQSTGSQNPYFVYRMDAAAQLYHSGKVDYILASGDFRRREYNEPAAMREALIRREVPSRVIYLDNAGLNTFDSVLRAHQVYGLDRLLLISQRFHVERAVYIGQRFGIEAIGFSARMPEGTITLRTTVREYFARAKAMIDVAILNRQPDYGSPTHTIPQ